MQRQRADQQNVLWSSVPTVTLVLCQYCSTVPTGPLVLQYCSTVPTVPLDLQYWSSVPTVPQVLQYWSSIPTVPQVLQYWSSVLTDPQVLHYWSFVPTVPQVLTPLPTLYLQLWTVSDPGIWKISPAAEMMISRFSDFGLSLNFVSSCLWADADQYSSFRQQIARLAADHLALSPVCHMYHQAPVRLRGTKLNRN